MSKIIKDCKKNQWKAYAKGIVATISIYFIMSILISLVINSRPTQEDLNIDKAVKILVVFFSLVFGYVVYLMSKESIFRVFITRKYEINHIRCINHIRLIEKCIDNNEKEKSELLFNQYLNARYSYAPLKDYFSGAIRAKFYDKLELDLN